jgi:hypothetical protein
MKERVDKLYYYLKNLDKKFLLFHNPRCACTTLKAWAHAAKYTELPEWRDETIICATWINELIGFENNKEFKKILVVRNPINRFISFLNFSVTFEFIGDYYGKERIDLFLDYLENIKMEGLLPDIHYQPQFIDRPGFFTHIIKLEDFQLIKVLNLITGSNVQEDLMINKTSMKFNYPDEFKYEGRELGYCKKEFDYSKIELITRKDLTEEQTKRIKELYKKDFYYYPEEL